MRALYLDPPASVTAGEIAQPQPGPGELLVAVRAAGITTAELGWYPTLHTPGGEARQRAVPAHEFSGVVTAVGENVGRLEIGQEVFGMNDWFADGALAECCITQFSSVAPKPGSLSHLDAASIPIAGLTAWQGLYTRAAVRSGDRVLIHGGAGAVGTFAIQLARLRGAHVIATASTQNLDFVSSLGANEVIDYRSTPFESVAHDIDVVFDTVGGDTLERSWSVLRNGGRLITVASGVEGSIDQRVKDAFFIVEPDQKQLTELADLVVNGHLRTVIDTVVPFSQASDAYAGRVPRKGHGKIVVDCSTI